MKLHSIDDRDRADEIRGAVLSMRRRDFPALEPGEFYRLQNFETLSPRTADTTLTMEGLALTGAWTDVQQGLVGLFPQILL